MQSSKNVTKKIKATEVSFNTMTGISLRVITFHDYDSLIFVIGRERTKRQYKNLDKVVLFEGHLDVESLESKKYYQPDIYTKQRFFPPQKDDLERDLSIWNEIKDLPKLNENDISELIQNEIKKEGV